MRGQLSALLVIAAGIGLLVGMLVYYGGQRYLSSWMETSNYIYTTNKEDVSQFQAYVDENNLSCRDAEEISAWVNGHRTSYMEIYLDGYEVYHSYYAVEEDSNQTGTVEPDFTGLEDYVFPVRFSEGMTDVFVLGEAADRLFNQLFYASTALGVLLFFCIILFGIRRTIRYIQRLEQEVRLLEGGNLQTPITVTGHSELTNLAEGLEQMRVALKQRMDSEEQLLEVSQQFVSTMAHDIRTPLTTMLLYTEILKQHKFQDEAQMNRYLDKIGEKATQIGALSNRLLERFRLPNPEETALEQPQGVREIFEGVLTDLQGALESDGFTVHNVVSYDHMRVAVSEEYIQRIMDNISSNLQKYAKKEEEIRISAHYTGGHLRLCFENSIASYNPAVNSTGIGILNIKHMMREMRGSCVTQREDGKFLLTLEFPLEG